MTAPLDRRKLLAKVHVAKKQLGLDEETYRDVLERVTGLRSAKELEERELLRVLAAFRNAGWSASMNPANGAQPRKSDKPHVRKIWAVWADMCRTGLVAAEDKRKALRAFVENRTGVTDPEWLTAEQATVVIESLKHWRNRGVATPKERA